MGQWDGVAPRWHAALFDGHGGSGALVGGVGDRGDLRVGERVDDAVLAGDSHVVAGTGQRG
jgi:hypothetical protein